MACPWVIIVSEDVKEHSIARRDGVSKCLPAVINIAAVFLDVVGGRRVIVDGR